MRFFEFAVNKKIENDIRLKYLREWSTENAGKLVETDDQQNVDEIKNFLEHCVTDPRELKIGNDYYPIVIISRPLAKEITLEVASRPLQYHGVNDDSFLFGDSEYRLPINHYDNEHIAFFTTTVYVTVDQCDSFTTTIELKFAGRWNIRKKDMNI
jgi:hypothetical protein